VLSWPIGKVRAKPQQITTRLTASPALRIIRQARREHGENFLITQRVAPQEFRCRSHARPQQMRGHRSRRPAPRIEGDLAGPHLTPTPGQRIVSRITITFQVRSVIDLILPASAWRGLFSSATKIALDQSAPEAFRLPTTVRPQGYSFGSGGACPPHLSFLNLIHQSPLPSCGNATCTASSTWNGFPGATRGVRTRATDPCSLETLAAAAYRCDSGCAMTGDARVAMAVAARITFRLVLIFDLM